MLFLAVLPGPVHELNQREQRAIDRAIALGLPLTNFRGQEMPDMDRKHAAASNFDKCVPYYEQEDFLAKARGSSVWSQVCRFAPTYSVEEWDVFCLNPQHGKVLSLMQEFLRRMVPRPPETVGYFGRPASDILRRKPSALTLGLPPDSNNSSK